MSWKYFRCTNAMLNGSVYKHLNEDFSVNPYEKFRIIGLPLYASEHATTESHLLIFLVVFQCIDILLKSDQKLHRWLFSVI